jgi:hypothetical protein
MKLMNSIIIISLNLFFHFGQLIIKETGNTEIRFPENDLSKFSVELSIQISFYFLSGCKRY